jgi:hypothetical protein
VVSAAKDVTSDILHIRPPANAYEEALLRVRNWRAAKNVRVVVARHGQGDEHRALLLDMLGLDGQAA